MPAGEKHWYYYVYIHASSSGGGNTGVHASSSGGETLVYMLLSPGGGNTGVHASSSSLQAAARKSKMDKDDSEKRQKMIEEQITRAMATVGDVEEVLYEYRIAGKKLAVIIFCVLWLIVTFADLTFA